MGGFMPPSVPKPGGFTNQVRKRVTKKRLPGRTNPDQGGLAPQRPPMPGPVMRGPMQMPPMPPPTGGIDPAPMPPMPPTGGIDQLPPRPPMVSNPLNQGGRLGGLPGYPGPAPIAGGLGSRRPLNQDAGGNIFGKGIYGGWGG